MVRELGGLAIRRSKLKGNWVARLGACLIAATMSFASAAMAEPAPDGGKFKVVTTFTVLQDIAQNVAGDKAEVVSITKPGAEIHDYQPTPLDIVKAWPDLRPPMVPRRSP